MNKEPKRVVHNIKGMSLVELMVAMVIGLFLVGGATQVYVSSRRTYADNESIARLQETARYAMSVIEPDVRMAGYWGLTKGRTSISTAGVAPPTTCGNVFAITLDPFIEGNNNAYAMGAGWSAACGPFNGLAVNSADTLTIRRASTQRVVASTAGTLQICTARNGSGFVIDGGPCANAGLLPTSAGQLSDLIVNSYYIAQDSTGVTGLPSLRRKQLQAGGVAGPQFADNEVIPGVEDMQVQFGINQGVAGVIANTGQVNFYINAADINSAAVKAATPALATSDYTQIVSVRVWLLVRSEAPELGFQDGRVYQYADRVGAATGDLTVAGAAGAAYQPSLNATNGQFRRLLISRTFQIRNANGT